MTAALPLEALEGHTLVVGTTGSGKSYLTRGLVERLRADGRRVGVVDKLGNFWGLTVSADGKGPGFEFVILGGRRPGAVPMRPDDGAQLGRLFVERSIPAIFDLSAWHRDDQEEWLASFADAVFEANEGSLHLVLDEAQSWVPQGGGRNRTTGVDAFGAIRRLAEQGRGYGIHLLMAVQRLSRIDKTVASMAGTIVAMRQTGAGDRKAVRELMSGQAAESDDLFDGLPKLPTGTGYVWNPVAGTLERSAFPANATFDSSRTPRHGDKPVAPIAVSSKLVEELKKALSPPEPVPDDTIPADSIAAAEKGRLVGSMIVERDERIAMLEAANAELLAEVEHLRGVDDECERYNAGIGAAVELLEAVRSGSWRHRDEDTPATTADDQDGRMTSAPFKTAVKGRRTGPGSSAGIPLDANVSVAGVTAGETAPDSDRELRALAGLAAAFPAGLTEAAWAGRTGYSRKGGAWIRRRKRYLDNGLIEQRDGRWFATASGVDAAGAEIPVMPAPGLSLVKWWADRLDRAGGRALQLLGAVHPRALSRDAIAAELGMAPKGGAFVRAIAAIKASELAIENGKRLSIADHLVAAV